MTIEALITGKVHKRAEQRTGRSGRPFVVATVRAPTGEAEATFINVVSFSDSAGADLLALAEGDAVALAGSLTPKAWTDREGNARPSLDMLATQVMTLYGLKKRRDAHNPGERRKSSREGCQGPAQRQLESEDFGPQDWPGDEP